MKIKNSLFLFFIFLAFSTLKASSYEEGLKCFNARGVKYSGRIADSTMINKAIYYFKKSYKTAPEATTAMYIVRSYYFKGVFTTTDESLMEMFFTEGKKFGIKAIEKFPNDAGLLYWHTIIYGQSGKYLGLWMGIKEDVSDMLEAYSAKLLELDPLTMHGGGYRINGILNYKLPYIPFILSWPDKDKAEYFLKLAIEAFPKDKSSNYFMVEFLFLEERYDEISPFLETIYRTQPRPDYWMEDYWVIYESEILIKKYNKKFPDKKIVLSLKTD